MFECSFPWSFFNESEEALEGVTTSVGIIFPPKIYETASFIRTKTTGYDILKKIETTGSLILFDENDKHTTYHYSKWEYEMIKKLNTFGLAK